VEWRVGYTSFNIGCLEEDDVMLSPPLPEYRLSGKIVGRQLPKKTGKLRNVPEY
jgi:hypothetical protein